MTGRAEEGEAVEIVWHLKDGSRYRERYTLPPKAVRQARAAQQEAAMKGRDCLNCSGYLRWGWWCVYCVRSFVTGLLAAGGAALLGSLAGWLHR